MFVSLEFGLKEIFEDKKILKKLLFQIVYVSESFFGKFSFSIYNLIIEMKPFDYYIRLQRCTRVFIANLTFGSNEGSWK